MDDDQKAVGAGGCLVLAAGGTYDAIANPKLPKIFEMIILTPGTFTTLEAANKVVGGANIDVSGVLGAYGANADIAKIPITFREDQLLAKVVSVSAVVILYFVIIPR